MGYPWYARGKRFAGENHNVAVSILELAHTSEQYKKSGPAYAYQMDMITESENGRRQKASRFVKDIDQFVPTAEKVLAKSGAVNSKAILGDVSDIEKECHSYALIMDKKLQEERIAWERAVGEEKIINTPTQNEKDTKISSQIESGTTKIENTSEAPRISKTYVLTHRQDLPETKPDSAIKAVTKQRGTLVGIEGSRFVLEKGGEQFKVETNKKLDTDAFSTGIGKKVNIHLNQTGERLSMIYLAGDKETDVVRVEQKFQGPAIPFGLVKAVDMSDEKNAHKTIHGELVAAYESATKQVMEVQTENGRLLVHGPKTEFSLPTIKKAIGKQVELKSEDHRLKISTTSRGVEIA